MPTLLVAVLTALFSAVLCGVIANLAVSWYRISPFEGGSGYFVVFMILAGFIGGVIIGVIGAQAGSPGFARGLGTSFAVVLGLAMLGGGISRILADVPPTLNGEGLILLVELRWPEGQRPAESKTHELWLGALSGHTVRARRQGALWPQDARQEDGRWVAPGAVDLFTNRGGRLIWLDPKIADGLLVPISGTPGRKDLEWSDWRPLPSGFAWKYKVILRSQPSRTETVGSFKVDTVAGGFKIRGPGLAFDALSVATLPGDALLVSVEYPDKPGDCILLEPAGKQTRVATCGSWLTAQPLGNDDAFRTAVANTRQVQGLIDRTTFTRPGKYLFADAIFDSVTNEIRPIHELKYQNGFNVSVPPIGLSPDGRSIVRAGFSETTPGAPALLVFDIDGGAPYLVAIDKAATRWGGDDSLSNAWLNHYYEWLSGRLVARTGVTPFPYRGYLHTESGGNVVYRLQPVGAAMKDALTAFIGTQFTGAHVYLSDSDHYVGVYGDDPKTVPAIAAGFDALLKTGKHDDLFEK